MGEEKENLESKLNEEISNFRATIIREEMPEGVQLSPNSLKEKVTAFIYNEISPFWNIITAFSSLMLAFFIIFTSLVASWWLSSEYDLFIGYPIIPLDSPIIPILTLFAIPITAFGVYYLDNFYSRIIDERAGLRDIKNARIITLLFAAFFLALLGVMMQISQIEYPYIIERSTKLVDILVPAFFFLAFIYVYRKSVALDRILRTRQIDKIKVLIFVVSLLFLVNYIILINTPRILVLSLLPYLFFGIYFLYLTLLKSEPDALGKGWKVVAKRTVSLVIGMSIIIFSFFMGFLLYSNSNRISNRIFEPPISEKVVEGVFLINSLIILGFSFGLYYRYSKSFVKSFIISILSFSIALVLTALLTFEMP